MLQTFQNISRAVLYTEVLKPMCHTVENANYFHSYKYNYIQVSKYCSDVHFKSFISKWYGLIMHKNTAYVQDGQEVIVCTPT